MLGTWGALCSPPQEWSPLGHVLVMSCLQVLRSHVMVRVGGGWDTLEHYLDKHDPCRCSSLCEYRHAGAQGPPPPLMAGATPPYSSWLSFGLLSLGLGCSGS